MISQINVFCQYCYFPSVDTLLTPIACRNIASKDVLKLTAHHFLSVRFNVYGMDRTYYIPPFYVPLIFLRGPI